MVLPHAINAANVKMRFPVFRTAPDALIEFAIEEANLRVDPTELDDWYLPAFLYLTAHILTRALQAIEGGTGVPLKQISVGGEISYSYATAEAPSLTDASDLATTIFGMRYLEMISLKVPAIAII